MITRKVGAASILLGVFASSAFNAGAALSSEEKTKPDEDLRVPSAPIALLISAAQLRRKEIWTKEIGSEIELRLTLRDYVSGIAEDWRVNRERVSAANPHWLRDLLAWHKLETSGKARYGCLASKPTLAARTALVKFAGKRAMETIDDCMEKFGPPRRDHQFWREKHGDPPAKIPVGRNLRTPVQAERKHC